MKFRVFILFFIYLYLFCCNLYGLDDSLKVNNTINKDSLLSLFVINDILVIGNNITKEEVILRELKSKVNEHLNAKILEQDIIRLYNLGLFTKVDVLPLPVSENRINLIFEVNESFYFIPIPRGGIKEGDIRKIWGGLSLQWRNFRGRNETLNFSFGVGYEPFLALSYSNPWIFDKHHYFLETGLRYSSNYNRSTVAADTFGYYYRKNEIPTFSVNNFEANIRVGKYLSEYVSLSANFAYNSTSVSEYQPGRTISTDGNDKYPNLSAEFIYDTRDIRKFSMSGSLFNVSYTRIGLFSTVYDLNKFRLDMRKFYPIGLSKDYSITLGGRLIYGSTFGGGEIPSYYRETFGYGDIIRGWDNYVFEGENKLGYSVELRIPLVKPFYVKGIDHPLVSKIGLLKKFSYRYGLYLTAFFDSGGVWGIAQNVFDTRFYNGFGLGLNFLLPFNVVGRIDTGMRREMNIYNVQFIFALDASF
ncbi:MAG: hypothetical protein NTV87_04180 [Ignavibacteriae bacterium]|nr:hypothetical protein [Ignavibacteriota bacterium]